MFWKTKPDRLSYISLNFKKWTNAPGNVSSVPVRTFRPHHHSDIVCILDDARKKGITVRPIGSGHSFSEVAKERYYVIEPYAMTEVSKYNFALKKDALRDKRHVVKAQAGIRIQDLNKKLDALHLALDNMGTFDWQTISGAISTGTHGTGYSKPAIPDMVRAIIMILSNGETWQIEPTDGITDPLVYKHEYIKLIQDDDLFYSAAISFGAMGIIYEIVLEVGEQYWIREERRVMDWDQDLKPMILNGTFKNWLEKEYDYVSCRISPYYTFDKKTRSTKRYCSVALQKIYDGEPPWHLGLASYTRNLFFTFLGNLGILTRILVAFVNARLSRIPGSVSSAIKSSEEKEFIARSHKVLYNTGLSIRKEGISSEFAFPVDYTHLVKVLDGLADHFSIMKERYGLYQSAPIPVRFVPQSKAYLSQCNTGAKMYIDLPTLEGVHGTLQIMDHNLQFMLRQGGVPHWGKVNYQLYYNETFIDTHYPKAAKWREIRNRLDPDKMFYSEFVKKMGL